LAIRRRSIAMVSRRSGMSSTTLQNGRADMASNPPEAKKPESLPVTKLEPTEAERAEIRALAKRKKTRRQVPRFAVDRQKDNLVQMMPAGVHADAAAARLMNAFGITDLDLAECLMTQIINATNIQPSGVPIVEGTLNAALAAVAGIGPRDEAEAMLAAQMIGVQWLAMALLSKAGSTNDRALLNDRGNLAVKLLRTFPAQLDALKRYRSAGEQRVVVQHQHVNVTANQAAVQVNGVVPDPGGRGAASETEDQPHEQQLGHASEPAMLCPEPARNAMPVAGCDGPGSLSASRRR
jgi:hypothetical protein